MMIQITRTMIINSILILLKNIVKLITDENLKTHAKYVILYFIKPDGKYALVLSATSC